MVALPFSPLRETSQILLPYCNRRPKNTASLGRICTMQINLGYWETAHLPLPQANINTSLLRQNVSLGKG